MAKVDIQFSTEGITASIYDERGLIDEAWYTWAEVEEMKNNEGSQITFEL